MVSGKPQRMKQVNQALVRDALRSRGQASKAEIATDTGLSQTTVGQLLQQMEGEGEIVQAGKLDSSGGRRAALYELDADAGRGYALALEEDRIAWSVCNALGTAVAKGTRQVKKGPVEDALSLATELRDTWAETGRSSKGAIALGVPGAVKNGHILNGAFEKRYRGRNLRELFFRGTGLPTLAENDLNATVLGYLREAEGAGQGIQSLAYLFFTEDCVGSGMISDGTVITGAAHFAGELRYLPAGGGRTLNEALASALGDDRAYLAAVADALKAVNCVLNPALIVLSGSAFRFHLAEALTEAFAQDVSREVRPELSFVLDHLPHYLAGLCALATDALYPGFRIMETRIDS